MEEQSDRESTEPQEGNRDNGDNPAKEFVSDEKECPECGAPIENLRANCPKCGYEYKDDDYDDPDAGQEFIAGSQVDDEGNEIPEDPGEDEEGSEESGS